MDIPFFALAFSEDVQQVFIKKCMIRHITTILVDFHGMIYDSQDKDDKTPRASTDARRKTKSDTSYSARAAALALCVMMFSVNQKKKESRKLYKTVLGIKFSKFRDGIVLTALTAAKNDTFCSFRVADDSQLEASQSKNHSLDMKSKKTRLPSWLLENCVSQDHITIA